MQAPIIAKSHGVKLTSIIHPATQCGKSEVEGNFGIDMRHVQKYVRQTKRDVTCPTDVVTALNHCGGIANSCVDFISLNSYGKANAEIERALVEKNL